MSFLDGSLLKTNPAPVIEPVVEKEDVLEGEEDVVLVEKEQPDGTVEKIVFSAGGEVDVYELERLCTKVLLNDGSHSSFSTSSTILHVVSIASRVSVTQAV